MSYGIIRFILNKYGINTKYKLIKLSDKTYIEFFKGILVIEDLLLEFEASNFGIQAAEGLIKAYKREHGKTNREMDINSVPATIITKDSYNYVPLQIKKIVETDLADEIGLKTYNNVLKILTNSDLDYLIIINEEMLSKYPELIQIQALCHEALHMVEDEIGIDIANDLDVKYAEEIIRFKV